MATSPTTATPPAPASRSSKLLIAGLISLTLCALAVAAYAVTRVQGGSEAEPKPARQAVEKPIFVALEPITVNLQQGEGRGRFLHVGMALKVRDEKAKAQVVEFMPELRSRALMMLSQRPG